ncbi:MAG: hypothetical protein AAFQ33_01505 [Pseudomonadota bacterium]
MNRPSTMRGFAFAGTARPGTVPLIDTRPIRAGRGSRVTAAL